MGKRKNKNARDTQRGLQLRAASRHHVEIHGEKPRAMSDSTGRGQTARDVAHIAQTDLFPQKPNKSK